ncbi:MAG TPA: polysaccharide deacetylase family protein [Bacteroidales bacterium]|nr:polysaccharide deacetylase family protein [Bacteroidales bacterium]HSA43150.1 polysaccharide deacetylase family protein [Bacteroidales bacterium]
MIAVLVPAFSPRLEYTLGVLLKHFAGEDYSIMTDKEAFLRADGIKINYTGEPLSSGIHVNPHGLLFEPGIQPVDVPVSSFRGIPVLFPAESGFPFDIFSASFYLLSRYEEYLPHTPDRFGRYKAEDSLAYRHGFSNIPVIDHWLKLLLPEGILPQQLTLTPTVDIDVAYAYRFKGWKRTAGGFALSLLQVDFRAFTDRAMVLCTGRPDPYDTYDYIREVHARRGLKPLFFVLCGAYGPYDKNIPSRHPAFSKLIGRLSETGTVGIHPSFASFDDPGKLEEELGLLAAMLGRPVTTSRQHYLRLSLPGTYRELIRLGITDDYSMGYAAVPGFRAGTSRPFPWYDLHREESTLLMVHPFTVMDGSLKDYLKLGTEEASSVISGLIQQLKATGGCFMPLWHNESFSDTGRWKGWRKVYENMLDEILTSGL